MHHALRYGFRVFKRQFEGGGGETLQQATRRWRVPQDDHGDDVRLFDEALVARAARAWGVATAPAPPRPRVAAAGLRTQARGVLGCPLVAVLVGDDALAVDRFVATMPCLQAVAFPTSLPQLREALGEAPCPVGAVSLLLGFPTGTLAVSAVPTLAHIKDHGLRIAAARFVLHQGAEHAEVNRMVMAATLGGVAPRADNSLEAVAAEQQQRRAWASQQQSNPAAQWLAACAAAGPVETVAGGTGNELFWVVVQPEQPGEPTSEPAKRAGV